MVQPGIHSEPVFVSTMNDNTTLEASKAESQHAVHASPVEEKDQAQKSRLMRLTKFEQLLKASDSVVDWIDLQEENSCIMRFNPPEDTEGLPEAYQNTVIARVPAPTTRRTGPLSYFTVTIGDVPVSALWDSGANVSVLYLPALLRISEEKNWNVFEAGFRKTNASVVTAGSDGCKLIGQMPLMVQYQNRDPVEVVFLISTNESDIDCILGTNGEEQFGFCVYDTKAQKPLHFDLAVSGPPKVKLLANKEPQAQKGGSVGAAHEFFLSHHTTPAEQHNANAGTLRSQRRYARRHSTA